jgi:hypothetical protein
MATQKEIVAAIKKVGLDSKGMVSKSVPKVAEEIGEELSGALITEIYEAEAVAFPELVVKGTQAGVKQARQDGLRFERIAARSGLSVGEVRDFAEKAGVGADFYIGRGRRQNGASGEATKAKKPASSGRRGRAAKEEPKAATSGRRGRGSAAKAEEPKARGRRGTRAAANPS